MKECGTISLYVGFTFGSYAYMDIILYENKTIEECIKIHSEKIDCYLLNHEWHKIG